ncbi:MAG TPA: ABC transporter ATP-binding protein [Candidatus Limnocylindrales bacterium]|nr:ABC transporter ATP-binding protein [Candidatus Limnocylindrales bacterium]
MNPVEVYGLKKTFEERLVLEDISLVVHSGDIYGLLGPNGSGKTTTLRILLGILKPDEGVITVLGMDPFLAGPQLRQRVNALPESYGLYGWMSALSYLSFFGQLYDIALTLDDYQDWLQQVGLEPGDSRPIRTFSQGMKQRLGIARAMINNPEVLFLDEPTNGLDPRGRREIHDLLLKLNREKATTLVISTHILDDVERLCTRIAILDKGKVRYEGMLTSSLNKPSIRRYRFHLENGYQLPSTWSYPGISLIERKGDWMTCLVEDMTPTMVIKTLINSGLPIIEVEDVSDKLEDLYLAYTTGGMA